MLDERTIFARFDRTVVPILHRAISHSRGKNTSLSGWVTATNTKASKSMPRSSNAGTDGSTTAATCRSIGLGVSLSPGDCDTTRRHKTRRFETRIERDFGIKKRCYIEFLRVKNSSDKIKPHTFGMILVRARYYC